MINQIAIAILAFTLGVILAVVLAWTTIRKVFMHAAHCSVCKKIWMDFFNEHEDTGTHCVWKKFMPNTGHGSQATGHEVPHD